MATEPSAEMPGHPTVVYPVHVGRQPVYDRDGDVVAYELLFRDTAEAVGAASRGSYATSQVIVAAFSDFGVEQLVGHHACFINVTREFLVGELPLPFDAGQVGLEILADIPVDDAVLAGVEQLASSGYTVAVDQFAVERGQEALLAFASYAKIDMLVDDRTAITAAVRRCARFPYVQLIAERLETPEAVRTAMSLGFQLFQGNALGRPHAVQAAALAPHRLRRIQLLVELNTANADVDRVAALVHSDPGLALRVLRLVNSAATGVRRTVSSIAEAIVLLGIRQLRQWVTLMVVADVVEGDEGALAAVTTHAQLCRLVAERSGADADTGFTAGLLTAVSNLLTVPVEQLTAGLPLADAITDALIHHTGPIAHVLDIVDGYQKGTRVDPRLTADMLAAIGWTNGMPPVR